MKVLCSAFAFALTRECQSFDSEFSFVPSRWRLSTSPYRFDCLCCEARGKNDSVALFDDDEMVPAHIMNRLLGVSTEKQNCFETE